MNYTDTFLALRSAVRRLRREIAGHKSSFMRLQRRLDALTIERDRLKAERDALKLAASRELIRYNVGPGVKQERIALAKRLRASYSTAEIAVLMGYSRQRIHQMLHDDRDVPGARKVSENLTLEVSQKLKSLNP